MRTFKTKTLYQGKAWIRDTDMERLEAGDIIQVKYVGRTTQLGKQVIENGEIMTLTPANLPELKKNRSDKKFGSRFSNKQYWLWAVKWVKDVDNQASLFSI